MACLVWEGLMCLFLKNEGNTFGSPINLKAPINSSYDDFSLSTNDKLQSGYVSTNRFGTPETDDIAYFMKNVKEPVKEVVKEMEKPIVKITVLDKYTSIPLPYVSVSIKDSQNNLIFKGMTDPNGQLTVEELAADNYKVQGILNDITTTLATISKEEFSELAHRKNDTPTTDPRFTVIRDNHQHP